MKTRDELALEGRELVGPLVPDWFKEQSDGCSVPLGRIGRWALKADQAKPACIIHDFRYYEVGIQYIAGGEKWKIKRMQADFELKMNRRLVAKRRFFGRLYAMNYFRAVRLFGSQSIKTIPELVMPPTIEDIDALEVLFDDPLTERAKEIFQMWKEVLS